MIRKEVTKTFNTWMKIRRQKPSMLSGLHLPESTQGSKSTWYAAQDAPELGIVEGEQLLLAPEVWLFKVNHDLESCDRFLCKEEHIIGVVTDGVL